MSFWQMPQRLYDDPEELADWTRQAVAVARATGVALDEPRLVAAVWGGGALLALALQVEPAPLQHQLVPGEVLGRRRARPAPRR